MKKHPIAVDGFDGSLEELAQRICRMRYDKVAAFFYCCAKELLRQSNADRSDGKKQLSLLLASAWGIARAAQLQFEKIFFFCAPHMQDDLGESGAQLGYEDEWKDNKPTSPLF